MIGASQNFTLRLDADDAIQLTAALQKQQARNTANLKAVSRHGIVIYVEFADAQAAGSFGSDLIDNGSDHLTGTAPRRPEIQQNRERRVFDFAEEVCVRDGQRFRAKRQGLFAMPAYRRQTVS
jgi:hypothetical protein